MNSIATQVVETAAATAEQAASPAAVEMSVDDLDMAGRGYAVGIVVETIAATAEQAASPAAFGMSVDDLDMAGRGYAVGIIG